MAKMSKSTKSTKGPAMKKPAIVKPMAMKAKARGGTVKMGPKGC